MNANRRKMLSQLCENLESLSAEIEILAVDETQSGKESVEQRNARIVGWQSKLEDLHSSLEECRLDEEEYFDNMPESLQGGEKGTMSEDAVSEMESALEKIEELFSLESDDYDSFNEMWYERYDDIYAHIDSARS